MSEHTTILLPPPCTNNNLHMGHLCGVYIPGDIYGRFLKMQGHKVLTVSGADQNNTYTELKSQLLQKSFDATKQLYAAQIHQSLQQANVDLDEFVYTDSNVHKKNIQSIVHLLMKNDAAEIINYVQPYCACCQVFLSDHELAGFCSSCDSSCDGGICEVCSAPIFNTKLVRAVHRACNSNVTFTKTKLLAIKLRELMPKLTQCISDSSWSPRLKQRSYELLSQLNGVIPLTNHYPKGNAAGVAKLDAAFLTIWHEAIWGGISAHLINGQITLNDFITNCNQQGRRFVSFMGQDTEFYYSIALSAVLLGLGIQPLRHHVVAHRFIKLDGQKFSSSRNHLIYLQDLLKTYPLDIIRLYSLSILYPYENDENDFILTDLAQLNSYFNKFVEQILVQQKDTIHQHDFSKKSYSPSTKKLNQQYVTAMYACNFREVYQFIMLLMKKMEYSLPTELDIKCWLNMLTPIMPSMAVKLRAKLLGTS